MLLALLILSGPRLADVPLIARLAGITVGATTIAQFERRHGAGLPMTGGHPRGAREWYDRALGATIYADGFNYSDDGEVIDGVNVSFESEKGVDSKIPRIRIGRTEFGILARVRPGMSPTQVEKALKVRLKDGGVKVRGLIKHRKKLVNKDNDRYTDWHAEFTFGPKGLTTVTVSGD